MNTSTETPGPRTVSRTVAILAVSALLALAVGCSSAPRQQAGRPAPAPPPPGAVAADQVRQPAEIDSLGLVPEGRRVSLELHADRPLVWTSFRDAEGDLVIELPNSVPAVAVEDLARGRGLVAKVDVELLADADRPLTRLTVHTREPTEHSLTGDGKVLRIELSPVEEDAAVALAYEPLGAEEPASGEPTSGEPTSGEPTSGEPTSGEPVAGEVGLASAAAAPGFGTAEAPLAGPPPTGVTASQLYAVDVLRSGIDTVIQVAGDGEFSYSTFQLENPERFVIDLTGVVNSSATSVVPVASDQVDQIRIGQFKPRPEPISRVVFDLRGSVQPAIERTADGLTVSFRPGEPMAPRVAEAVPAPPPAAPQPAAPQPAAPQPAAPQPAAPQPVAEELVMAEAAPEPVAPLPAAEEPEDRTPAMPQPAAAEAAPEPVVPLPAAEEPEAPAPAMPRPAAPQPAAVAAAPEPVAPEPVAEETLVAEVAEPPAPELPVYEPPAPEPPAYEPTPAPTPAPVAAVPVYQPPPALPSASAGHATSDVALFEAQEVEIGPPIEEVDPVLESFGALVVSRREREWVGEPIDMSLRQADLVETLRSFATISDLNFVIQPGVSGSVTVELKGVPWDQAMLQILKINNLGMDIDGTIVRIAPLNQLRNEAQEELQLQRARQDAVPLKTVLKALSYSRANAVQQLLRNREGSILSDRGSVQVDQRTNTLIIRELPSNIDVVLAVIENLDSPEPQVMIEARIIEATKSFSRSLGIEWGYDFVADQAHGNTSGLQFPNNVDTDGRVPLLTGGATGFINMRLGSILDTFNLDARLQVAENEGLVNLVSAPRVTTLNNTAASIQSGVQIPIQTVSNRTVSVQFVNATLQLQVTPQVTAEGTIVMDINVAKRSPAPGLAIVGATNSPIQTREARTKVIVRDGGTTVIGGIYEVSANDTQDRVPGLANIPILGHLFKNRNRSNSNDELMIFITPRIIQM